MKSFDFRIGLVPAAFITPSGAGFFINLRILNIFFKISKD
jgi:hypothetical protein